MTHIAIFCDGTWNSPTDELTTNVHRLYQCCAQTSTQVPVYFSGVGTGGGVKSFFGRMVNKLGGGAFGWGLNDNIKYAYLELCKTYKPGDKIMIFGFSRGAYTARSLAGMVRKCGILAEPTQANTDWAFKLYRKPGAENAPDEPHIWAERRTLSPAYATSQKDIELRNDDSFLVRITYLGIWDTVGALGIPESLLGPIAVLWNGRYRFHDTRLSSLVESARHAVALDERRVFYVPSLWDNLEAGEDHPGLNQGNRGPDRPYQQVWFVGDHSIVGGSAHARGLGAITLAWIWEGAEALGRQLKPGARMPDVDFDPIMVAPEIDDPSLVYRVAKNLLQWRDGPGHDIDLHESVLQRTGHDTAYRPRSLYNLRRDLFDD